MEPPTAVIADDEPRLALYLQARLAQLWPELRIVGIAANGPEAQALIATESPDIAFLDIRMPGLSGLDVARAVSASAPGLNIVFVTAFDQYALDAFDRAAVDYLLKPVGDDRLAATIARLRARLATPGIAPDIRAAIDVLARLVPRSAVASGGERGTSERLAWIRASAGSQVKLIAIDDVAYFQSNDKYTSVFTADGEALIRTPLKDLAQQLDAGKFWQIHRGTIINVAHIMTTTRDLAGRVAIALRTRPERLAVARAYAHLFKQM
jgi:DNA-binding LytR/AlgR family response regulator